MRPTFKFGPLESYKLVPFTDPVLFRPLPEFDFQNPPCDPHELTDVLYQLMYKYHGAGLSANQVGLLFKAFVFGTSKDHKVCFNPKIVGQSKETSVMKEACLSLPGVELMLARPTAIVFAYQDEKGELQTEQVTGWSSRVIQHETDHMYGRNFTMLASRLKLDLALKKATKRIREGKVVYSDILQVPS